MLDRHLKLLQFLLKTHQSTLVLMKLLNMSMFQTAQFAMISMLSIVNFMDDIIVSIKSKGYQLNTSQYTLETITERYAYSII